jgi:copper(I)-binding protein
MQDFISRRRWMQSGVALVASAMWPTARACEFFASTLRVTHPWTRVTPQDASFAIVNMKIDMVTQSDRLIGVETPVATGAYIVDAHAQTSAGLSLPIPKGHETLLGEKAVQLRLTGLTQPLLMARTYPMRLIFEKGGVLEAELNVDYNAND